MIDKNVKDKLLSISPIEAKQVKKGEFYLDLDKKYLNKQGQIFTINHKLLSHHSVYISKHNRFAPYPLHQHNFVEINYVLQGKCREIVNGKPVYLKHGDILLMDQGCKHSLARLGKNDLLINLVFNDHNISFNLLNKLHNNHKNSLVYDFLLNISLQKQNLQSFIIFPNNPDITRTMDDLINEYYLHQSYSNTIIENYFNILLAKIIRYYPMPQISELHQEHYKNENLVISILNDISKDYQQITLTKLAKKYGYSTSYLSNLIKEKAGLSFAQLKIKRKLAIASYLLNSTNYSVEKICVMIGEKNKTSFYRQFERNYHCSPAAYRQHKQEYL